MSEGGVWWVEGNAATEEVTPISFTIPLTPADANAITVHFWRSEPGKEDPECPGTPLAPLAEPGTLCLYVNKAASNMAGNPLVFAPGPDFENENKVGTTGVWLYNENLTVNQHVGGSYAITAP